MSKIRSSNVRLAGTPSAGPHPSDMDTSVVFRGDGEPKSTDDMLRRLTKLQAGPGLEADNFSQGGTVGRLEERIAEMLGKDAAIFMPTGTLANHLAIRKHCVHAPRAIVQEQSHLYKDTGDSVTQLSGVTLVPLAKDRPYFELDELIKAVTDSETGRVTNPVGAVMIESPVRRHAGRVVPYEDMEAITGFCRSRGIPTHLDGARLYMMSAATGVSPREYTALFDTVYVSLYKYFGAPYGAILAGTSAFVSGMYHDRRMFGGGLPSTYVAAGLALSGTEGFETRFASAMARAHELFQQVNRLRGIHVRAFEHGSNIFPVELDDGVDIEVLIDALSREGVFVYPDDADPGRIHLTVNTSILRRTNDELVRAFQDALTRSSRKQ